MGGYIYPIYPRSYAPVFKIRSSHGHSTPSLKVSCKSVQPFSGNLANKETKKERYIHTNKEIDQKQYHVPRSIGDRVKNRNLLFRSLFTFLPMQHAIYWFYQACRPILPAARRFALQHLTTRHRLEILLRSGMHSKHACMLLGTIFTHAAIF